MFSQLLHSEPGPQTPSSRPRSPRTSVALRLSGSASVVLGASPATPSFASLEPACPGRSSSPAPLSSSFLWAPGLSSRGPGLVLCFLTPYPFTSCPVFSHPHPPLHPPSSRPGLSPGTERPPDQWAPKPLTHPVQPGAHQPPSPDPSLSHPQREGVVVPEGPLPLSSHTRQSCRILPVPLTRLSPPPSRDPLCSSRRSVLTHVRWGHVSYGRLDGSG